MGRRTRKYRRKSDGRPGCVCPVVGGSPCCLCSGGVALEYDLTFTGWQNQSPPGCSNCSVHNTTYTVARTGAACGCYWEYFLPSWPSLSTCYFRRFQLRIFAPGETNYKNEIDATNYWVMASLYSTYAVSDLWAWGYDLGSSLPACSTLDGLTLGYLGVFNPLYDSGAWQDPGDHEDDGPWACKNKASGMDVLLEAA